VKVMMEPLDEEVSRGSRQAILSLRTFLESRFDYCTRRFIGEAGGGARLLENS
jgi:hypothetical protein